MSPVYCWLEDIQESTQRPLDSGKTDSVPPLPLASLVTYDKDFLLFEPQFLHLENENESGSAACWEIGEVRPESSQHSAEAMPEKCQLPLLIFD